jgi:acetyl esterase/lipase
MTRAFPERPRRLLALLPLLLQGACAPADMVNALVPRDGYEVAKNLTYGQGPRHMLDLYRPVGGAEPMPVVVFFYGGNWQSGSKEDYLFVGQALAAKGYVVVIPDYRIYPEVRFPVFVEDGAQAVRWAEDNVARYGGDPHRLFLMGHSAGAYIAAMITLDGRFLADVGLSPKDAIRGTVGLAGPYDFLPIVDDTLKVIFGPEEAWPATQPITYADGSAPPMLLITGTADNVVDPGNSQRLADRITAKGGSAEVKTYTGIGHQILVGSMAAPLRFLAPVLDDSVGFMETSGAR